MSVKRSVTVTPRPPPPSRQAALRRKACANAPSPPRSPRGEIGQQDLSFVADDANQRAWFAGLGLFDRYIANNDSADGLIADLPLNLEDAHAVQIARHVLDAGRGLLNRDQTATALKSTGQPTRNDCRSKSRR